MALPDHGRASSRGDLGDVHWEAERGATTAGARGLGRDSLLDHFATRTDSWINVYRDWVPDRLDAMADCHDDLHYAGHVLSESEDLRARGLAVDVHPIAVLRAWVRYRVRLLDAKLRTGRSRALRSGLHTLREELYLLVGGWRPMAPPPTAATETGARLATPVRR